MASVAGGLTGLLVGGLVGAAWSGTTISNAYATGSVSGSSNVGGLVGACHNCTISNAYASVNVSGGSIVGGLVGSHDGTISQAYATGSVMDELVPGHADAQREAVTSPGGTLKVFQDGADVEQAFTGALASPESAGGQSRAPRNV